MSQTIIRESEEVRGLKQKLHQSFKQVSDMERLMALELEQRKRILDEREILLSNKEVELKELRHKKQALEDRLKTIEVSADPKKKFAIQGVTTEVRKRPLSRAPITNNNSNILETELMTDDFRDIEMISPADACAWDQPSLDTLGLILSDNTEKAALKQLEELQMLCRQVYDQVKSVPDALKHIISIARTSLIENVRILQELANSNENIETLNKRIEHLAQVKSKSKDREDKLVEENIALTKKIISLQNEKEALMQQLKTNSGSLHQAQICLSSKALPNSAGSTPTNSLHFYSKHPLKTNNNTLTSSISPKTTLDLTPCGNLQSSTSTNLLGVKNNNLPLFSVSPSNHGSNRIVNSTNCSGSTSNNTFKYPGADDTDYLRDSLRISNNYQSPNASKVVVSSASNLASPQQGLYMATGSRNTLLRFKNKKYDNLEK